jgi:membrane protein DedA with SNARE-associated domain
MTAAWPITPAAVAEWMPFAKAAGVFLATFVLEDAAAIGAGLLLATGGISWPAAFAACFLGIWMGDAGLYSLARYAGRGWFERSALRRFAPQVAQSERWFAARGSTILVASRLLPGARLPAYLAAGFLRVPLPRFLLVTGLAACGWTAGVLLLAQSFGARLPRWLGAYKHGGLLLLAAAAVLLVAIQLFRRAPRNLKFRRLGAWAGRLRRWEFWPAWMFYPPVGVYCAWLAIKYRGLTVPTAANPGIFSGGLVGESKMATLRDLLSTSPEFTAEAELVAGDTPAGRAASLAEIRARLKLDFPFILKPDVGQRGAGVKLIRSAEQADSYLRATSAPVIAQRYAPGPCEAGVFYYRFPGEAGGHIFAITEKIFPVLAGDGESTVAELVWRDPRARFLADKYLRRLGPQRDNVLPAGRELRLVEAGNHAQGCVFRDGARLRAPGLEARLDQISRKLDGFFVGRYDLRFSSEDDLRAGKNFQIIELNGAASEATSVYDARNSLLSAYRTLFRQWDLVFAIGAENRRRGVAPTKLSLVWRKWREYSRLAATYPPAD